jgi:dihydrofolate synthase / folylpolyglutamate synthase
MEILPIKTRVMVPPKDDLFSLLDEGLTCVKEKDIILVTSKVVAIHQGRCVPVEGTDKRQLVESEAEYWVEGHEKYNLSPLAIKYNAMFYAAGIDASNSNGYYTLLPDEPSLAAKEIWQYVREKHQLNEVGVIISDSHTVPLRWGCIGISIGFWGFNPLERHAGKTDLFGRTLQFSSTNIVDGIAAAAGVIAGEADEATPIVIARDVPNVVFTDVDTSNELSLEPEDDIYAPILKVFFEKKD